VTTPQMDWLDDQRRQGVLGAGFYGPTEREKRRRRNATPWLPPLSCDPRLTSVPRVGGLVTQYIVRNGPGGMTFTYDDMRDALVDLGRYVVACNAMHWSQEQRQVLP
jgi:hypothetical protein